MKNVTGQATAALYKAKALALRLTHLQLSPLSAIVLIGLSTMALTSGLFALYAVLHPTGSEDGVAAVEWKPPTLAIVPLDPPKPAEVDVEALSRPIFSKTRKPGPKAAAAPTEANATAAPGTLSVTAIVRNKKSAQAFFVSSDAPEGVWRKIGDTVDSWTVTAIAPKEVLLQSGGQTTKVKLYADPPPGDPAAATQADPPQHQPQHQPQGEPPANTAVDPALKPMP